MSERREFTRAEQVRLRREQERAKEMQRALKQATQPLPPARAKPERAKKVNAPKPASGKRRFQIALPEIPRVNFRALHMPTIPRPRFGWRSLSFLLVVLCGVALYLAFARPELRVAEAQVTGNQILTPAEINSALGATGQPIFTLIPSDLETRLRLDYPELASVQIEASLPNLLAVRVIERKPVIRWEQGGGYTWIAADGVAFRPRGEMIGLISVAAESAPPVVGSGTDPLSPTPFIPVEMVQAVQGLGWHVPPGAVILYNAAFGFGWNDPRGWRAYFGTSASDVELKMRVYEQMVASLTQRGIRPALINVTYPSAPYYRMNQ
ncbi:MAG: FtsQ-type POTRA domain-containing protein [Anaerolineales bacterium]|nr:FtsQ-type POTRA domain-containing protein [Anaerolineales bacterium]